MLYILKIVFVLKGLMKLGKKQKITKNYKQKNQKKTFWIK